MRVAFLGNDAWSVAPLRALAEPVDIDVELVVTNPPRPAGRGSELTPTAVAIAAEELGLSLLQVDGVRTGEGFEALGALEPDALVVVAYGEILTPEVLEIPRLGSVNVHFSLLPRWRGAAPVQRAILEGDETTGVTVMLMDEGMDTGPILASEETPIRDDEDAGALGLRLAELGGPLLVETLRRLDADEVEPSAQSNDGATRAPKPNANERVIDWSDDADAIVRRIRAFAPEPGAVTTFREQTFKVLSARDAGAIEGGIVADGDPHSPGRILRTGRRLVVATGAGRVELIEVVPAGRRRMTAFDWVRGARPRLSESFG